MAQNYTTQPDIFRTFVERTGSTQVTPAPFDAALNALLEEGWEHQAALDSFVEWYHCKPSLKMAPLAIVETYRAPRVWVTLLAQADIAAEARR